MKKIKMYFMAEVDYDSVIDDGALQEEYGGDILKAMQYLYEEEGIFWDGELKLINAELVEATNE